MQPVLLTQVPPEDDLGGGLLPRGRRQRVPGCPQPPTATHPWSARERPRPGRLPATLGGPLGGAPASGWAGPARRPCPRAAGRGDWLASAPPPPHQPGSWRPPPLQCLPPSAPEGRMHGPATPRAPEEAGRGRAGRRAGDAGTEACWGSGGCKKGRKGKASHPGRLLSAATSSPGGSWRQEDGPCSPFFPGAPSQPCQYRCASGSAAFPVPG